MEYTMSRHQLSTAKLMLFTLCCTVILTGMLAEETLPPPGGGEQARQPDNTPQQVGEASSGKQKEEEKQPADQLTVQNDTKPQEGSSGTLKPEDEASHSKSSPLEGIASPMAPTVGDGKQPSETDRGQTEGTVKDSGSGTGGTPAPTEPATPSGQEKVKDGDTKLDLVSKASESKEPEVPEVLEKPATEQTTGQEEGKPTTTTQGEQVPSTPDQVAKDDQQKEQPTKEDVLKEPEAEQEETAEKTAQEEKMPSFDEWKQKMLAEQAEQAKQAKQVKLEAQASQPASGTLQKAKTNNRVNYASMSCGAKLIAANAEAKNSGSILTENKDQYMIQPCHAKKWFVVELCEPVAVQSLEIANLELFSSLPESFVVHIAERYPTKEWKTLGTFRARDQRAVQTFPVLDEELFAKYIKVEPLTHYGEEHYCPLTILRVYGTTAVEDYEEAEHVEAAMEEELHVLETLDTAEEPSNLFTSATDTVLSLVKTVLSPGEKEKEGGEKLKGLVQLNGTANNQSAGNTTMPSPEGEQAEPCTPSVTTGEAVQEKDQPVKPGQPETPSVTDQPPLVRLIESRPHSSTTLSSLIARCDFCQHPDRPACYAGRRDICGYYRVAHFVPGTSCMHMSPRKLDAMHTKSPEQKSDKDSEGGEQVKESLIEGDKKDKKPGEKPKTGKDSILADKTRHTEVQIPSAEGSDTSSPSTPSQISLEQSQGSLAVGKVELEGTMTQTASPTESVAETGTVPITGTTVVQTKPTAGFACDSAVSDCSTMGPDVVQIRPTTTEEATRTVQPVKDQIPEQAQQGMTKIPEPVEPQQATGTQAPAEAAENKTTNGQAPNGKDKVIYAEPPQDYEYDLETIPPPEDGEPIQKLSSGRRETAFMRLRNRIKALELNLNLSSRYLEELSQRYRRQMENMYLSLNKTIQKLTNTSRTAELRDIRQQANITELTKRINYLTEQTQRLTENFNNIHTQVIERHLFLMMIEGMVFLLLVTWLLNRMHVPPGRVRYATPAPTGRVVGASDTSLRPAGPNNIPPDKPKKPTHKVKRRNSIDATPPRPRPSSIVSKQRSKDDIGLRLSGSENGLESETLAAVAAASVESEFKEIVNRRKKKKKQNRSLQMSHSTGGIHSSSGSSGGSGPIRSSGSMTRVHRNAGLIFTSKSSRDISPQTSTGSESGENAIGAASGSSVHTATVPSLSNLRHNKAGARRSLDLHEIKQAAAGGTTNNKKDHKRQRSDGMINKQHGHKTLVTDIGPTYTISKASNGKLSPTQNGHDQTSSDWKSWLIGTRR